MRYEYQNESVQQYTERMTRLLLERFELWKKDRLDSREDRRDCICLVSTAGRMSYECLSVHASARTHEGRTLYAPCLELDGQTKVTAGFYEERELGADPSTVKTIASRLLSGWKDAMKRQSRRYDYAPPVPPTPKERTPYARTMVHRWQPFLPVAAEELWKAVGLIVDFCRKHMDHLYWLQHAGVLVASGMTVRLGCGETIGARTDNRGPGGVYPVLKEPDGSYMNTLFLRRECLDDPASLRKLLMEHYRYLMIVKTGMEETEYAVCHYSEREMKTFGVRRHVVL